MPNQKLNNLVENEEKKEQITRGFSYKNPGVMAFLCLLFGFCGIHTFYASRFKSGVVRFILGLVCVLFAVKHFKLGYLLFILAIFLSLIDLLKITNGEYRDGNDRFIKKSLISYVAKLICLPYFIVIGIATLFLFDPEPEISNGKDIGTEYHDSINKFKQSENNKVKLENLVYEGDVYKIVQIGNQIWMAENLKAKKGQWYCYGNNPENCEKYGMLYDWASANSACPTGWHLPKSDDWNELFDNVGGIDRAGKMLKAKDSWKQGGGINSVDFEVLPAGAMNDKRMFINGGYSAFFWSSTETRYEMVKIYGFHYENSFVSVGESAKYFAFSVRCMKNKEGSVTNREIEKKVNKDTEAKQDVQVVKIAGKNYKTVKIGEQTWMAENLNIKTSKSKCYKGLSSNCKKYGRLYRWEDAQMICPEGWHLPSFAEWKSLVNLVGGKENAGTSLKSESGWKENGNGDDLYGFSALPAGIHNGFDYEFIGYASRFWSSTEVNAGEVAFLQLGALYNDAMYLASYKSAYYSIRCVKDD